MSLQRPLLLQGHTRAITQVKYNREGDLIFSAAKDNCPSVWFSSNGERLGTYDGHNGTVWCIDVDWKTEKFLSGGGDMTIRIWDCNTGKEERHRRGDKKGMANGWREV
jgi:translation initiation factor 3 subunit I